MTNVGPCTYVCSITPPELPCTLHPHLPNIEGCLVSHSGLINGFPDELILPLPQSSRRTILAARIHLWMSYD